jgi:putative ABC transport system permease protein
MFKNYLITAFRNLIREKNSATINIAGLTLGITCSVILFLIISYHNSFDRFHGKRDRIFRIVNQSEGNNGTDYQPGVPTVLPDAFRLDFPEAEQVVFTSALPDALILIPQSSGEDKKFQEELGVVYTEPSFFAIFDRKLLTGNAPSSLDEPNEAVIGKSWAHKFFGTADVIGKVLRVQNEDYKITAVMEDAPDHTDLPFNLMLSYVTVKKAKESSGWNSISSDDQCYFALKEGEKSEVVASRLDSFSKKHLGDDRLKKSEFYLQSLGDLHFDTRYGTYSERTIPKAMLRALGVIAIILVLTACINFVNLATAEAVKRSKEVGVRKTLGGSRTQLVLQFLGETTFITLVSVVLALGLTQILLGFINPFLELNLSLNIATNPLLVIFLLSVTILVAIVSGAYPAFVVSGFKPALALKNKISNRGSSGYYMRSGLVVLQFLISQFFIIGTLVLIRQMDYVSEKDLGFRKEAIVIIPVPDDTTKNPALAKRTLRDQILGISGVEAVSLSSTAPSSGSISKTVCRVNGSDTDYVTQIKLIDESYIQLYELDLANGKNVADLDTATGFIINETFARIVGVEKGEEMLGREMTVWGRRFPVVGVVKDFHTSSLENEIEPVVMFNGSFGYRTLSVKLSGLNTHETIQSVKAQWEDRYPNHIFEFEFMDESIRRFYESERKMTTLLSVFSTMAIFIGCLGLFGLATFMANQKTKEIGVRKVLGASVENIVLMFSTEFAKLIGLGFLLAAPLAGFAMQQFLNEFAYKTDLSPIIFFSSLLITVAVAVLTVGYRSFRAAKANPVNSLKYE